MSDTESAKEETVYEGSKHGASPNTVYEESKPSTEQKAQPGTVYEGGTPGETEGGTEKEETVYEG